jgi:hypothetical protein
MENRCRNEGAARRTAGEPVVRIDNEREANGIPLGTTAKVVLLQGEAGVESAGVVYESGKQVVRHTPKTRRISDNDTRQAAVLQ